jgi:transposase
MSAAVRITRTDHSAEALRGLAAKNTDGAQVRRLLALSLVLDGHLREVAAARSGMDRQTLRDWVHRYNAEGVAGLRSVRIGGHAASLTEAQMSELKELTIKGPNPEKDKIVRWRCVDLRDEVIRRFMVTVSERTIGKWLRKMGQTRLQPRPFIRRKMQRTRLPLKKIPEPGEGSTARQHDRRR